MVVSRLTEQTFNDVKCISIKKYRRCELSLFLTKSRWFTLIESDDGWFYYREPMYDEGHKPESQLKTKCKINVIPQTHANPSIFIRGNEPIQMFTTCFNSETNQLNNTAQPVIIHTRWRLPIFRAKQSVACEPRSHRTVWHKNDRLDKTFLHGLGLSHSRNRVKHATWSAVGRYAPMDLNDRVSRYVHSPSATVA